MAVDVESHYTTAAGLRFPSDGAGKTRFFPNNLVSSIESETIVFVVVVPVGLFRMLPCASAAGQTDRTTSSSC